MKLDSVNSTQTEHKAESGAQTARKLRTKQAAAEEMARLAKQAPGGNSMAAHEANSTKEMLYSGVLSKLRSGQELSGYELSELRKRDPAMYAKALRGQRARQELRARLQKAKTSREIELARQAMGLLAANAVLAGGMPTPSAPVGGAGEGGQGAPDGMAINATSTVYSLAGNNTVSTGTAVITDATGVNSGAVVASGSTEAAPAEIPEGELESGYAIAHRALRDEFGQFARKREKIAQAERNEKKRAGIAQQHKKI